MSTPILHANWSALGTNPGGALHLWAELPSPALTPATAGAHPAAADHPTLERLASLPTTIAAPHASLSLLLPAKGGLPLLSFLARGTDADHAALAGDDDSPLATTSPTSPTPPATDAPATPATPALARFTLPSLAIPPADAVAALEALENHAAEHNGHARFHLSASAKYWATAARFVRWLLVQQRLVPTLVQDITGALRGLWQPWLADEVVASRLVTLLAGMPPSARAVADPLRHEPWPILEDFLVRVVDAQCRAVMLAENMVETIESRRAQPDAHVQWLAGLLETKDAVPAIGNQRPDMLKRVRAWVGALDQRGSGTPWRLAFRLDEPIDLPSTTDFTAPGPGLRWNLSFHLQSVENPAITLDARDIWVLPTDGATISGKRCDKPQELLLAELGRAARLYKPVEDALREAEPVSIALDTTKAYDFLREVRPALIEQGFGVQAPHWWESPGSRLGVRLRIDSPDLPADFAAQANAAAGPKVGLDTLVSYRWQVTIDQTTLSLAEFEKLANLRSPLVLIGGRWVEVRPEDVKAAVEFIRENPGGKMEIGRALRLAYAADAEQTGLPVLGMEASGWVASVFSDANANQSLPMLTPPPAFVGSLRPYQLKGLSWLAFLDRFGLGSCLADDMGLGKTIQLLAMLLHEREHGPEAKAGEKTGPTLLIVPMSVVGNWVRETRRFAPSINVYVHHGAERRQHEDLVAAASSADLVISTYALAHRDREQLAAVQWGRIALDEAQNIKNPAAKQTQAIRSFHAPRRVALTGTPIENRLSELWSIMDFLNPGILGSPNDFRRRFALPIERYHDPHRAKQLRGIVQPFVLRRLKTDSSVIADLPEKIETKEHCYLTPEQAALYESTVKEMLSKAESSEGIQRRGVILAGLVRLKQICNHPHHFLKEHDTRHDAASRAADPHRSGKCTRLVQMLDEVVASGGQALVFTQFRAMGTILAGMLKERLERNVLFLHGGTTAKERENMVAAFQKADGSSPIFILSLKAGGVGLNLTGANHVFHFDRWWNPAVESQATDRAFRIGQTRTVQVHKFVVSGTLEERIDQMIEQKAALADNVIGSGEAWLTELSLTQLRDVLTLRPDAVAPDEE
jgi:hypothetical protein